MASKLSNELRRDDRKSEALIIGKKYSKDDKNKKKL